MSNIWATGVVRMLDVPSMELFCWVQVHAALQRTVEAILGLSLHTQNFRRALDKTGFAIGTGAMETGTGGRPAELYRFRRDNSAGLATSGLSAPRKTAD